MSRQVLERSLPSNVDAERSLLGSILVNNENYYRIVEFLRPEDFYLDSHRVIFRHMTGLMENARAIDLITLQDELLRNSSLESSGGIGYLSGLLDGIPHLVNIEHYISIVRDKALLRQMINSASKMIAECFDQAEAADVILDQAEQALFNLSERRTKSGFVSIGEMEEDAQKLLTKLYEDKEMITGVPTGFTDLDRMTSGFQPGDLVILAARPSMGKTSLVLNVAEHVALKRSLPVGIFSLEMSKQQLLMRFLCAESMVDAHKVRTGYIGKDDFRQLIDALGVVARAPLFIDDSSSLTIMEMRAKARRLKAEHGLSLLIVDYLQLMSGYGRVENRVQEISGISRGLKGLAKELEVPIIALSQLSRAPEQRQGDHRPQLSDLRESGSIEQDADVVLFIYREEVYKRDEDNDGKADLIISKQRNGPIGTVKLAFLKQYTKFENLLEGY
ncbi:MAG TPA: replicative DNA helicase [Terriglobia bacterium]|nr:replicative DNA helicase [Terriglobia bacterium]